LRVPVVVYALIAINLAAFVLETNAADAGRLIAGFAEVPYDIRHGVVLAPPSPPWPPLTLVTSLFVHGGILHIAFNLLFLLFFGPEVEFLWGHARFLALYLAAGLAGGLAQFARDPQSHVPTIGASGAIAGVLGAYIVCAPLTHRLPAIAVIGVWAATQFASGFDTLGPQVLADGGTAYFAHIGGFCAGVLVAVLYKLHAIIRIAT
jgi:membrane associated rhomboid family serine protease